MSGEMNCNEPDKDSADSGRETIFEDYAFTDEHRKSMLDFTYSGVDC